MENKGIRSLPEAADSPNQNPPGDVAETACWMKSLDQFSSELLQSCKDFSRACATISQVPSTERDALEARLFSLCGQMVGLARLEVMQIIPEQATEPIQR